ncbi:HTH_48 domain-containing protein [Trichonephila clavipes]|nr:HTH_48 domain-containing protein [Trichonephila clavipes]
MNCGRFPELSGGAMQAAVSLTAIAECRVPYLQCEHGVRKRLSFVFRSDGLGKGRGSRGPKWKLLFFLPPPRGSVGDAQSITPIEIHRQLCQVYGLNIMSKHMVRRWCRQFSEGRQSVHDEEYSKRPSLIIVELVRQRVMENSHFTVKELSSQFPQIS